MPVPLNPPLGAAGARVAPRAPAPSSHSCFCCPAATLFCPLVPVCLSLLIVTVDQKRQEVGAPRRSCLGKDRQLQASAGLLLG